MEEKLSRFLFGQMSEEEKSALFDELETNKELREMFIKNQQIYSLAQMLNEPEDMLYANKKLQELKHKVRKTTRRQIIVRFTKYAAVIVLLIGLWFTADQYLFPTKEEISYIEYVSQAGKRKEIVLPDGTKVWLAPSSKLKAPASFISDTRCVELDGEALFDVTKNERCPFVVKTTKYNIEVLGTVFNVLAYSKNASFETSLLEGSVALYKQNEKFILKPNERAILENGKLTKTTVNTNDIEYLRSGVYQFEDVAFTLLLDKISVWYDITFQVEYENRLKHPLSGKLRENDHVENILEAIQRLYPFQYKKITENSFIIY